VRAAFEFDVVQNTALSAVAIHAATLQHYQSTARTRGVAVPGLMLVLPIILHQPSRMTVAGKVLDGSFYKAISEDRAMVVGLQSRMQSMASQSFRAINLAVASGLIGIQRDAVAPGTLIPSRMSESFKASDHETRSIIAAAKRVGHWLATVQITALCSVLNVRF